MPAPAQPDLQTRKGITQLLTKSFLDGDEDEDFMASMDDIAAHAEASQWEDEEDA